MSGKLDSDAGDGADSAQRADQETEDRAPDPNPGTVSTGPESPKTTGAGQGGVPPSSGIPAEPDTNAGKLASPASHGSRSVEEQQGSTGSDSNAAGTARDPYETQTREDLLNQFYATLRVMYLAAQQGSGTEVGTASQHERIRELLYELPRTWAGAYEIEQLLAFVMADNQVAEELPRRVAEARALNLEFVEQIEAQFNAALKGVQDSVGNDDQRSQSQTAMRYILQRLLNDLQWFYKQRIRRREAAKRLSVRVSALFMSAFFFFFCLLFIHYFSNPPEHDSKVEAGSGANSQPQAPQSGG